LTQSDVRQFGKQVDALLQPVAEEAEKDLPQIFYRQTTIRAFQFLPMPSNDPFEDY